MWIVTKTAEKKCKKGYYIYCQTVPKHPSSSSGWVPLHRVVIENHLGRMLGFKEVVHHKNLIKHDNRIENLEVMSWKEHSRMHGKEFNPKTIVEAKCPECETVFLRDKKQTFLTKKVHKWAFCSRKCSGKFSRSIRYQGMTADREKRIKENIVEVIVV